MKRGAHKHSAKVNIGGKEVNINIDLGNDTTPGPIHLAGDGKIGEGGVSARTEHDMQVRMSGASSAGFSNPTQNVRHFGFKEGMHVADFGSGSGAYTLALATLVGRSGVVYAVDIQRDLLTRIQNNATQEGHENVEIIWGDIESSESIGIKDGLLDGVVLANTLFQVEDKIAAIKEAWRVLKPGGILAVIDWTDSFGGLGPQQNHVITQTEATLICTDNGFAFKNEFNAGEHHYGLVCIKMVAGESSEEVVAESQSEEQDFISRTIAQELI